MDGINDEFRAAVELMRDAQRDYFSSRKWDDQKKAMDAEREVDRMLREMRSANAGARRDQGQQTTMFS